MRARRINLVLRNRSYVINGLRIAWVALVLWFELGVFRWSIRGCIWPDAVWREKKVKEEIVSPAHLLVIADTQVLDSHSLPSIGPWLRRLVHFIVESNLKKSWVAARNLNPDGVLFLGDMINGGRYARSDEEYDAFATKFKSIFTLPSDTPAYYVVGNHDVGLGRSIQFSQRARGRFERSFDVSQPNRLVDFGNHSLVLIDAPGLVEEDYRRVTEAKGYPLRVIPGGGTKIGGKVKPTWVPSKGGAMEFINGVAHSTSFCLGCTPLMQNADIGYCIPLIPPKEREAHPKPAPLILFSHIPLARTESSSCGPLREGQGAESHIQKGAGPGYQNLLGKATSTWMLETLEPNAIFTADDHDYCEITHSYLGRTTRGNTTKGDQDESSKWTAKRVKETTVKAFSMNTGIWNPGLQLISLWNPTSPDLANHPADVDPVRSPYGTSHIPTFADKACLLPDQSAIYTHGYLPLIFLSLILIAWLNLIASPFRSKPSFSTPRNKSLPFFDTPGNARFSDTPPSIDDQDDTPRGHTTSHQQGQTSTLLYSDNVSGSRTPVSRGGSPFPSPLLSPVLVPTEMGGDSEGECDDDDDNTPTGHGGARGRIRGDEEKGFASAVGARGTGVLRTPATPASPWNDSSYLFPSSPTPRSGKWGRGATRSLFGQAGLGIGLGAVGSEREREKASKMGRGWRRTRSGAGGRFGPRAALSRIGTVGQRCWYAVSGIVLGRAMSPRSGVDTFWRRCSWDAVCVAFSSWATFGLVTWWFIW